MTQIEQRQAAKKFAKDWENRGYEKGDSQLFWTTLLENVFGISDIANYIRYEEEVQIDKSNGFIDGRIPSTKVLIEQKSIEKSLSAAIKQSDGSYLSPFEQAKRYIVNLPVEEHPRWVVICNFKEFNIYDMNKPHGEPEVLYLKDLEKEYYRLSFLVDNKNDDIAKETEISIKAGDLVGLIYNKIYDQYNDEDKNNQRVLKDLNTLCVRLVFCFYAEDAGLFGKHNMFHDYLKANRLNARDALYKVFRILNQKENERDKYLPEDLLAFPYVNGGLFEKENIIIPQIPDDIVDLILQKVSAEFDWSEISPTIFGAVFESTLNPETRRKGGMHYTSIENIHKVIDPLFLDDLKEEFENIKKKTRDKQKILLDNFQKNYLV